MLRELAASATGAFERTQGKRHGQDTEGGVGCVGMWCGGGERGSGTWVSQRWLLTSVRAAAAGELSSTAWWATAVGHIDWR